MEISRVNVTMPKHTYFKFKNKCNFYEMRTYDVITFLVEKFIKGDYDEELNIPKD